MAAVPEPRGARSTAHDGKFLPAPLDRVAFTLIVLGFLATYVPTFTELARTIWSTDEQGHGPIILAVSWWLLFSRRHLIAELPRRPSPVLGWSLLIFGVLLHALGVSQQILMFQAASQIAVIGALMLIFIGKAALRASAFPLFFLIFMIPLPEALVAAITAPLKIAVSTVATSVLYNLGYPIGRSGVMLTIGQYQLLVADACAGLNSMFTLEALGMLYMHLLNYTALSRNIALAILLVPISFLANVVRVIILVLVTYYLGDEVGQGYVHGFAGMVLFAVALMLMLVADRLLGLFLPGARRKD